MTQLKPVRGKAVPRYPQHDYLQEHPELLYTVPARWRQNALVLRVLGGVVSLVLASQTPAVGEQANAVTPSRIAPLFLHGEGRGTFGCVAINPPVFLSEDEARQVIQDEAKKAGLEFAPDALTIKDVNLPLTNPYWRPPGDRKAGEPAVRKGALVLDGFDAKHNVGYEFVSGQDFDAWKRKDLTYWSSVSDLDMKGTAEKLRTGLEAAAPQPRLGVFYEPGATRKLGEEELRKQVRDFIQWLKAQGVI